ncbi:MAG: DUF3343 domain-containing protein [bacterium]|nr:MAG: DUF3343 domain-containing protein [bacterium]
MTLDVVLVFPTTHLTLRAERSLREAGIGHRTVMKPRKISSDCGLAIRIAGSDLQRCRELLLAGNVLPAGFYREAGGQWDVVARVGDEQG